MNKHRKGLYIISGLFYLFFSGALALYPTKMTVGATISMIAGAIFGGSAWVATSAYFIGMAAIVISGIMLKKTKMFAGDPAPFVMELPAYRFPSMKNVLLVFNSLLSIFCLSRLTVNIS